MVTNMVTHTLYSYSYYLQVVDYNNHLFLPYIQVQNIE